MIEFYVAPEHFDYIILLIWILTVGCLTKYMFSFYSLEIRRVEVQKTTIARLRGAKMVKDSVGFKPRLSRFQTVIFLLFLQTRYHPEGPRPGLGQWKWRQRRQRQCREGSAGSGQDHVEQVGGRRLRRRRRRRQHQHGRDPLRKPGCLQENDPEERDEQGCHFLRQRTGGGWNGKEEAGKGSRRKIKFGK